MGHQMPAMQPAPADVILRHWVIKCTDFHRQTVPKLQRYWCLITVPALRQQVTPCPRTADPNIL